MSSDYFATFIVPTYNQADYVRESLLSILDQDCAPCEVLVADDCSTDRTFEVLHDVINDNRSHHEIKVSQNKTNLGSGNIMSLAKRASARYIVAFHGDDVFNPDRASRLIATMQQQDASMVTSNARLIDAAGTPYAQLVDNQKSGFLELSQLITKFTPTQTGSTHAFEKSVIDEFLPWSTDAYWFAGDHVLPFRAALLNGCYYLNETLLDRRQHQTNQGKEIKVSLNADLTPEMQREIKVAHYLAVRSFMLRDTEVYAESNGHTAKTRRAISELTATLSTHLAEWSRIRTELLNSGLRPSWIDGNRFRAAIDTSAMLKGNRRNWRLLTQFSNHVRRFLDRIHK